MGSEGDLLLPAVLVVAIDAELRQRAFALLAERGYRVDAVGDFAAGQRRLERDEYAVLLCDDVGFDSGSDSGPPRIVLGPWLLDGDPPPLLARVAQIADSERGGRGC